MNSTMNTPFTLVTDLFGSGKTTLFLYLLGCSNQKIVVLMNEFDAIINREYFEDFLST